jgi:hypothetical protein
MKLRTIGAILTGVAMIGATMASASALATLPGKEFWIDPATGEPNVTIVVGAGANASDVVSASIIAGKIGNMATVQATQTTTKTASATFDKVYPYNYGAPIDTEPEAGVIDSPRPAKWYTDYTLFGYQLWDTRDDNKLGTLGEASPPNTKGEAMYSTDVQIVLPAELKDPNFQKTVARELNSLWYSKSPAEWDSKNKIYKVTAQSGAGSMTYQLINTKANGTPTDGIARTTIPALAGGSYDDGDTSFDFDYAFMTTKAWVDIGNTPATYDIEDTCDYAFGGTGTGMEAHEEIQVILSDKTECDGPTCAGDGIVDLIGDKGHASGIVYRVAEIRYPLLENGQNICGVSKCDGMVDFETAVKGYQNEIKFLGKYYNPIMAGATYWDDPEENYLGAYFVSGKPYAEKERILKVGDSIEYHGWTISLNDVNIYENKAFITVSGPTLNAPFSFIMVMDSQGACTACCPTCAVYGGGGAFTSNPTMRNEYDPYLVKTTISIEKNDYSYDLFKYVSFMLDGIKTFVGADGTYLAEFNLYALDNVEYLRDKGCCDPFVTTPNDYGLAIYGGWRKVAYVINERDQENIYPGNVDSPYHYDVDTDIYTNTGDYGAWVSWEDVNDTAIKYGDYLLYDYALWEPAPSINKVCSDANFDTLELQLCDKINIPNCETTYTINGPENYFSIEIQDVDFGKASDVKFAYYQANGFYNYLGYIYGKGYEFDSKGTDGDGVKMKISQTVVADTITYTANVSIDPIELIKLDIEINTATQKKNMVLVGGPVYNSIVKDLQGIGASQVNWATSAGEWEWITDPYAKGYDVLIVAGANREETKLASVDLVNMLN